MTDILYIVGKGFSDWRDNELRYSLRSIAANGVNVGKVVVCGYCPYWLNTDEVVCLPLRDPENGNKHANIIRAIDYAIRQGVLGETFLYSSDDHYYVQPTDFDIYPAFWRGRELPATLPDKPQWYDITMNSTHEVLAAMGLPTHFFAWHGNTWFNSRLWHQRRFGFLLTLAEQVRESCDPHCLMLNYWLAVEPSTLPEMVERTDFKVQAATVEEISRLAEQSEVLTTPDCVNTAMRAWLKERFPKKCKYER